VFNDFNRWLYEESGPKLGEELCCE
jgi:hypothetical protein